MKVGAGWRTEDDIGSATLAISNMSAVQRKRSPVGPTGALEVVDFEVAVESLRAADVVFAVDPMDGGVSRVAIVLDPDGNAIAVHQQKAA